MRWLGLVFLVKHMPVRPHTLARVEKNSVLR